MNATTYLDSYAFHRCGSTFRKTLASVASRIAVNCTHRLDLKYISPQVKEEVAHMEIYSTLITGSNRGIGLEFTRQILQLDPPPKHVFATYRNSQKLEALQNLRYNRNTTELHLLKMDVRNESEIQDAKEFITRTVKENGLTLLINNAGVAEPESFPNTTTEGLNYHFTTNTVGQILVTQAMYPLLKASAERAKGNGMSFSRAGVLNMSSMDGSIENTAEDPVLDLLIISYKISKVGLNMAMKVIAANLKPDNILVVNMCPGCVKTDMARKRGELEPKDSIAAMLATLAKLDENHTGMFFNRNGIPYPF